MLHFVVRARRGFPLSDPDLSYWLWGRLRRHFPRVTACVFMGNHLHLVLPTAAHPHPLEALRHLFGQVAAWPMERIPEPQEVQARDKQRRLVRYLYLNPCRARLTREPERWLFSTLRDGLGVVHDPWVSRLSPGFLDYVQADGWASRRSLPPPARDVVVPRVPLQDCVLATRACLRRRDLGHPLARTVFLQLARRQGWTQPTRLAGVVGLRRQAVYEAWSRPDRTAAARACLADRRLIEPLLPSSRSDRPSDSGQG